MSRSVSLDALPPDAVAPLKRLGAHIRRARIRRSMPMADVAARCLLTLPTLRKVERGDPTVSLGAVVAALWALGLQDRLGALLDVDPVGEALEARRRPKTVGHPAADDF